MNALPVAVADTATTTATQSVWINSTGNDTDVQKYSLAVTSLGLTGTKGIVTLNPAATNGVYYTPGAAFAYLRQGETATDSFTYTISDGHGGTATATDTVTITGVNAPPVAVADTATTTATQGVWINSTGNDTDVQKYSLAVTSLGLTGTKGIVTLNPAANNGVYYTPGAAFAYLSQGETATDSFTYTISDGHGGTSTATDTVTITGVNAPPVAKADTAATTASAPVQISLLANDTDVNRDDTLSVTAITTANTQGSVALSANGVVTYTPGAAFQYLKAGTTATDSFGYTVSDNHGASSSTTDTVTITGAWLSPTAVNDTVKTTANKSVTVNVLANDSEPEPGQTLIVSSLNLTGTNGTAVINANGTITYTPGAAFAGLAAGSATSDKFSYTVSDGHGGTSTASVAVTVGAPGASSSAPLALYVATNGNDAWAGDLATPNAAGTDGPLATLQAAQAKMEASTTTKTTYVEGGNYYLNSTLSLGAADNGESWLAAPGQTPVIYGGQQVTGWVQGSNGVWTAPAPTGSLAQGSALTDLFVNGTREIHARYPDYAPSNPVEGGWLTAAASLPNEDTTTSFQFNPGDLPVFSSTAGLYVTVYQQNGWQSYSVPVASINYTTDTITLGTSVGGAIDEGSRYYIYNADSQLNATNEWYGNSTSNSISLDAPAGFTGSGVTIGSLTNIISINGASNVTIAGLTLEDTTTTGSAIRDTSGTNITIAGNTIDNVGNGITLANSGDKVDIEGNMIQNTDNNGVLINPGTNDVTIKGNTIQNIGQQVNGDGIWFTNSSNDVISNNLVQNVAHIGIGGGSTVGISDASYNDTISYNQVANTNEDSSDGGGIYIGGRQLIPTRLNNHPLAEAYGCDVLGLRDEPVPGVDAGVHDFI